MKIISGGTRLIRPPVPSEATLTLEMISRNDFVSGGSEEPGIVNDANVLVINPGTIDTGWDIVAYGSSVQSKISNVLLTCSPTGLLTGNRLTRVSDGDCTVTARTALATKTQTVSMLRSNASYNQWQSWIAGSLAAELVGTSLTGLSIPSWRGGGFGYTAISPRHVIGCEHVEWMPPELTLGGVTRTLVSQVIVGPANIADNWVSDLRVGLYDGDFPAFVEVLPANCFSHYLPSTSLKRSPVVCCNQFGQMYLGETGARSPGKLAVNRPTDVSTSGYAIAGDSGNPAFFIVDGQPVLLGLFSFGGRDNYCGTLTTIHDQIDAINAAMTTLGGGYQLTEVDLTEYPNYGD